MCSVMCANYLAVLRHYCQLPTMFHEPKDIKDHKSSYKTSAAIQHTAKCFSTRQCKYVYWSLVMIQHNQDMQNTVTCIPFCWQLTYRTWYNSYFNFQEQLCFQLLNCRRRKSVSLHQFKPMWHSRKPKCRFFLSNVTNLDFIIQYGSCLNYV